MFVALRREAAEPTDGMGMMGVFSAWIDNMREPSLREAFALRFCILFAFIGTFTYVNSLLVRQPFELGMMSLGFVYFVFLPSIVTTPLAGPVARRCGARLAGATAMILAALGLPLLLLPTLPSILPGLVLISVGTFFAQAVATGLSAARHAPTAQQRAACTWRVTSPAGSSAARCLDRRSIGWVGLPASPASVSHCSLGSP